MPSLLPIPFRRPLAIVHDAGAIALAWFGAYWLRFNLEIPEEYWAGARDTVLLVIALHLPIYWQAGLYRGLWRYASVRDLRRILLATALAALTLAAVAFMARLPLVPRSVLVLHPLLLICFMGGGRFVYRVWKDRALYGHYAPGEEPVLVLGAGTAAERLLRSLESLPEWQAVGLLGNEDALVGRELRGVRILGLVTEVGGWAERMGVRQVVLAMPELSVVQRREAIAAAMAAGLTVLSPSADFAPGAGRLALHRVDLEDLLGRPPVQLDMEGLAAFLAGRTVLVTGAGGSIGSELARQIARFKPERLVLFDVSEFALYRLEQEFLQALPDIRCVYAVGDVKDERRLAEIFSAWRPAVVFHAAAYKHVPLMEDTNAGEAIRNNVAGSLAVARAAVAHGAEKFVLVSTDKAVNPTNVMGATKRLAERCLQGVQAGAATQIVIVRFGNVLGSNGSVVPKFQEQIARGGPVTVTHPEVTRYFMLIPEAAQLVLQAGWMGNGGEIYVLEMGEAVRIADLARDMIRLSGYGPEDIPVVFTGLRPGEKLYEELLADNETTLPTPHPKLRIARAQAAPEADWQHSVGAWLADLPRDAASLKHRLREFVPEYTPDL